MAKKGSGKRYPSIFEAVSHRQINEDAGWRGPTPKYSPDFKTFLQTDKHRERILDDMSQVLEDWFREGVSFDFLGASQDLARSVSVMSLILGKPAYVNMPQEVADSVCDMQRDIFFSICDYAGVTLRLIPEILMASSAWRLKGKTEEKVTFRIVIRQPKAPALWPVWDTRDLPPKERARLVVANLYLLHAWRMFGTLRRICRVVLNEDVAPRSALDVDGEASEATRRAMANEQTMRNVGASTMDIIEMWALEEGFTYVEISDMEKELGIVKTPEAIRKKQARIKTKLQKLTQGL